MHTFISHSRVNSSAALRLCDELVKRGVETWLDIRNLNPGAEWDSGVVAAIEAASGFVFLIGPDGPGDRWQTFECQQVVKFEYYLDAAKPLIPVLIGTTDMPGFLKSRRSFELSDTLVSFEQAADGIVSVLNNPASSIDENKLKLGRQAQEQALERFREYSQALAADEIKRVGLRAIE